MMTRKTFKFKNETSGYAMMIAVVFFLMASGVVVFGTVSSGLSELKSANDLNRGKESYFLSEAGVEDMVYRLKNAVPIDTSEVLTLGDYTVTTQKSAGAPGKVEVTGRADRAGYRRSVNTTLVEGSGAAFFYGVQVGEGGVVFENSSSINGNLYSNGLVTGSGNTVRGDIISAGPTGKIKGMHATSSLYAHTLETSSADLDAHYQVIDSSTAADVDRTLYPGSADLPPTELAISDDLINQWESEALDGGVITTPCPYVIDDTTTIGPKKINCDLEINGTNFTVTLTGPVWVNGTITIKNSPTIKVSSTLGGSSVALIADKATNRTTSSKIDSNNSAVFQGSGQADSYVMLVSQNNSAQNSGNEWAINLANSASGALLLYAAHGEVMIQNSTQLKEVTGYRIRLKNSAVVTYESGLANLLFRSGPSGGYAIDSWQEVE